MATDSSANTPHASDASDALDGSASGVNVNRWERLASIILGGLLLVRGITRRSLGGAVTALVGGWVAYRGISGHSILYRALGVNTAGGRDRHDRGVSGDVVDVERTATIGKSPDELSRLWLEPDELARIVGHVAEVTATDEDTQRWTVRAPFGRNLSWETEIVENKPGELLRWRSVEGATLPNEGSLRFSPAPVDRGTEVRLRVRVDPPGGVLGSAVMEHLGVVPEMVVKTALRRFKSLAETGEIPTLDRNSSARGSGDRI